MSDKNFSFSTEANSDTHIPSAWTGALAKPRTTDGKPDVWYRRVIIWQFISGWVAVAAMATVLGIGIAVTIDVSPAGSQSPGLTDACATTDQTSCRVFDAQLPTTRQAWPGTTIWGSGNLHWSPDERESVALLPETPDGSLVPTHTYMTGGVVRVAFLRPAVFALVILFLVAVIDLTPLFAETCGNMWFSGQWANEGRNVALRWAAVLINPQIEMLLLVSLGVSDIVILLLLFGVAIGSELAIYYGEQQSDKNTGQNLLKIAAVSIIIRWLALWAYATTNGSVYHANWAMIVAFLSTSFAHIVQFLAAIYLYYRTTDDGINERFGFVQVVNTLSDALLKIIPPLFVVFAIAL